MAEPRCEKTDMLVSQCAHCRPPAPAPPRDSSGFGPWFAARYVGVCDGCGNRFAVGDQIRADGDGGYLCSGCGRD